VSYHHTIFAGLSKKETYFALSWLDHSLVHNYFVEVMNSGTRRISSFNNNLHLHHNRKYRRNLRLKIIYQKEPGKKKINPNQLIFQKSSRLEILSDPNFIWKIVLYVILRELR
jgi:hypothetical protein